MIGDKDMGDLSKNFSLVEFTESPTAKSRGIDNTIHDEKVRRALEALVKDVLQPLRDAWGSSLHVNSGYRCAKLNAVIPNSSKTSQHVLGEAADIAASSPYKLAKLAKDLRLNYDQMILYPTFVHFSHKLEGVNRRRILYNSSYKGKHVL